MTIKLTEDEIREILKNHIQTLTTQELSHEDDVELLTDGDTPYMTITAKIDFSQDK